MADEAQIPNFFNGEPHINGIEHVERDGPIFNVVDWDAIKIERIRWLLRNRMPFGEYTSLEGGGGIGKTTIMIDVSARFTTGRPMPDGTLHESGNVLLIAEEDRRSIIKARLLAAGADLDRVHLVSSVGDDEHYFTLPTDGEALLRTVRALDARIVVIDALFNHFDQEINANRAQDVRRALRPLSETAHLTGAAVTGIRHWTKTRGAASDRGNGSVDIGNIARSVISVGRHPSDEGRYVAIAGKGNLAPQTQAMSYRLISTTVTGDGESVEVARVEWGDDVAVTANDIANADLPSAEEGSKIDATGDFVLDFLADGPRLASEVCAAAEKENIARPTLYRAAKRRGVVMKRSGFQGKSTWSLPVVSVISPPAYVHTDTEITETSEKTNSPPVISPSNHISLSSHKGGNSYARETTRATTDKPCGRFKSVGMDGKCECGYPVQEHDLLAGLGRA